MQITAVSHNIVLLAKDFRPSLISDHWLIVNNIAPEQSIVGNRVSSELLASVSTTLFDLLVVPERIQISLKNPGAREVRDLIPPAKALVGAIDAGYTAAGMNHAKHITLDEGKDVATLLRDRFATNGAFDAQAGGSSGLWGGTVIKEWNGGRFRTAVSALLRASEVERNQMPTPIGIIVECNFNCSTTDATDRRTAVMSAIDKFEVSNDEAHRIAASLLE